MEVTEIIGDISRKLQGVTGVVAVVLGGSRAKGTHTPKSDIDIGIYYDGQNGFDMDEIGTIASSIDDAHRENLITRLGEWGPWINGGGWITVRNHPVDFLFRDIRKVFDVIEDCLAGKVTIDYQAGHAHGFVNAIYAGEIANCKILWEKGEKISNLKKKTTPYPSTLKKAIIEKFLWEASFSLIFTKKSAARLDASHAAGYCFRAVSCLNQALFAKNEVYCMNETGALDMADAFSIAPANYKKRVNEVFQLLAPSTADIQKSAALLHELITETESLIS